MLTLLTCAIALAPSALSQRVIFVPPGQSLDSSAIKKLLKDGVIVAQRVADTRRMLVQPESISPYAIQPRRDMWPYSQLPANPKPSDSRSNVARPWLIKR